MGRADEDCRALSRHREIVAEVLRSLSICAEDLLRQPHDLLLDSLELRGFNAVHLLVPRLEQDSIYLEFLGVALRRKFAVHARLDLMRQGHDRDIAPLNAVGQWLEGYECPSQPQAQEHSIAYCERVARMYPWTSMEILGLGFRSFGAIDERGPELHFYKSICFCSACQYGYGAAGAILEHVAREVMEQPSAVVARHPSVDTMLLWRRSVQYGILRQIRDAVSISLCLRTMADLRHTGDESSLTFEESKGLAAACSVPLSSGDASEVARLAGLARPMPIYCCLLPNEPIELSQQLPFAGCIQ